MHVDVVMPQMGESITEGTITKWLKKVGDPVSAEEPLFEISTDKVDAEIPAPAAGYLAEIRFLEGSVVAINLVVAVITSEPPSAVTAPPLPGAASHSPAPAPSIPAAPAPVQPAPVQPATVQPATVQSGPAAPAPLPPLEIPPDADQETLRRLRSSPVVRKIASEHQIDLRSVKGTGLSGRVTRDDILLHVKTLEAQDATTAQPAAPGAAAPAVAPREAVRGGEATRPAITLLEGAVPPQFLPTAGANDRVEAMSVMRKKIAEHMIWSKRISPHASAYLEADVTRIARLREAQKETFQRTHGLKLTFMPFFMQAAVAGLKAHPACNASIRGDEIIYHPSVHLGMAVALDWGLIVPVIRHADEKNLLGLARALQDVATRARNKKLMPDEVTGGTFSITNFGAFGCEGGTPIINQPQVAILGIGAVNKRPWVLEGPEGDTLAIRSIVTLTLSFDHRLVDGAAACGFLAEMKRFLENYSDALL